MNELNTLITWLEAMEKNTPEELSIVKWAEYVTIVKILDKAREIQARPINHPTDKHDTQAETVWGGDTNVGTTLSYQEALEYCKLHWPTKMRTKNWNEFEVKTSKIEGLLADVETWLVLVKQNTFQILEPEIEMPPEYIFQSITRNWWEDVQENIQNVAKQLEEVTKYLRAIHPLIKK